MHRGVQHISSSSSGHPSAICLLLSCSRDQERVYQSVHMGRIRTQDSSLADVKKNPEKVRSPGSEILDNRLIKGTELSVKKKKKKATEEYGNGKL